MRALKPKNQLKSLRVPFSQRCVRRRVLIPPALGQRRRRSLPERQLLLQTVGQFINEDPLAAPASTSATATVESARLHSLASGPMLNGADVPFGDLFCRLHATLPAGLDT